jgi:putative transposase
MDARTQTAGYPSDLTAAQLDQILPLIPPAKPTGRDHEHWAGEILNAIFYVLRSGCAWRMLPHDFPPWQTVYGYFRQWKRDGTWKRIHDTLRDEVRRQAGRDPQPSAAMLDSQTVKTTERGGVRGYDSAKKINGRKRHILVDTMGLLLVAVVHAANIQDRDGAKLVFEKAKGCFSRLKRIWADNGYYAFKLIDWVRNSCHWILEIVKRPPNSHGFEVLPRRWVVERTFAWFGRYRRLSKDYEFLPDTSETMMYIAMIHIMARRLAPATPPGGT